MSEAEFDSYLSLLSKCLRLSGQQRGELADELQDHLETRLGELLARGKSREEAVRAALDEFGDAALLADRFSRLASRHKRRFVVRTVTASAAVVAAVVLITVSLAPPGPDGVGPEPVVAQQGTAEAPGVVPGAVDPAAETPASVALTVEQEAVAALDARLGHPLPEARFEGVALREAVKLVAELTEADVLFDEQAITEEGLNVDDPVDLSITRTKVSARTVLEFLLEPRDLAFVNRSGVIFVTTQSIAGERLATRVYNVRDLLDGATSHAATPGVGLGGPGFYSIPDVAAAMLAGGIGQGGGGFGGGGAGMGGMGGGMGAASPGKPLTGAAAELVETVRQVTSGPWFEVDGSGGTMSLFNGLLVIRQTEENHAEIQKLLDALREAGRGEPGGSVTVPKVTTTTSAPGAGSPEGSREAVVRVFRLENARSSELVEKLGTLLSNRVGRGPLRMVDDDRTNSIIVTGPSEELKNVEELLRYLDQPEPAPPSK